LIINLIIFLYVQVHLYHQPDT